MAEIFNVLQMRVQETHQFNNGIGISLTHFFVLESEQVLDHLLNMPSILTHYQVVPGSVIFHVLYIFHVIVVHATKIAKLAYKKKRPFSLRPFHRKIGGVTGFSQVNAGQ